MNKNKSSGLDSPCTDPRDEQEAKLQALRAALIEGENSGTPTPFDFEKFISRKRNSQNHL